MEKTTPSLVFFDVEDTELEEGLLKRTFRVKDFFSVHHLSKNRLSYAALFTVILLVASFGCFSSSRGISRPHLKYINSTAMEDDYGNLWLESQIFVNNITVDYFHNYREDTSLPYLVFFHGGGTDGSEGIEIFGSIAHKYRAIFPSARGFGKSTKLGGGTAQMVADAEALLPLVLKEPYDRVFVLGHSMGATIAPRVARDNSSLVTKLVLEDPGWLRLEGEDPSMNWPGYEPRGGDNLSNESVMKIIVPTLILTSQYGDGVPQVVNKTLESYPQGEKYYFAGAGHCIHCDNATLYLKVVEDFLLSP